jgi:hypothetical protein
MDHRGLHPESLIAALVMVGLNILLIREATSQSFE